MDPVVLPIGIAVTAAQIKLSQHPNKRWGLLLPAVSLVASIAVCICFFLSSFKGDPYTITLTDGTSRSFATAEQAEAFQNTLEEGELAGFEHVSVENTFHSRFLSVARLFFGVNFITLFLLFLYWYNRKYRKQNQEKEIHRMIIKDLK